jgi:hypothetical protein
MVGKLKITWHNIKLVCVHNKRNPTKIGEVQPNGNGQQKKKLI